MNVKADLRAHPRRGLKLAHAEIETMQRRRVEHFQALAAIAQQFPMRTDVDGRARGAVFMAELAKTASVSRKAIGRALKYWQQVACALDSLAAQTD